jgi:HEAT repeat protein
VTLLALFAVMLSVTGCSQFDEFSIKKMNFEVFREPDNPLQVVRESKDGNARARALRCLREPARHGGSQQEQDAVVALLNYSASHELEPWCRIAAIDSLRKFQDPRAVEGLKEAYYRAGSFAPETSTAIRCQALAAMGELKQPAAVEVLVRVLREPPVEGADQDRDLKMRERHVAARALGQFREPRAASALVEVLRTERDDVLRNNAHQSLVSVTGRELPPDAKTWSDYLRDPRTLETPPNRTFGDRVMQLTGFKE